jgi:hypothetical protein
MPTAVGYEGVRVTFADGRSGVIPFADLPEIGDAYKVKSIELPNPYELVLTYSGGAKHEIPWVVVARRAGAEMRRRLG